MQYLTQEPGLEEKIKEEVARQKGFEFGQDNFLPGSVMSEDPFSFLEKGQSMPNLVSEAEAAPQPMAEMQAQPMQPQQPMIGQVAQQAPQQEDPYTALIGQLQQQLSKPKSKWDRITDAMQGITAGLYDADPGRAGQGSHIMRQQQQAASKPNNLDMLMKLMQMQESRRSNMANEKTRGSKVAKTAKAARDPYSEFAFKETLKSVPKVEDLMDESTTLGFGGLSQEEAVMKRAQMLKDLASDQVRPSAKTADSGTVRMTKGGKPFNIPANKVKAAMKAGYKRG